MPEIPLPYPVGGLSDNYANDQQPPLTTRDAQNERAVDPSTNRVRGGQRAGFSKFSTAALGAGAVRAVQQVTYDGRTTTFTNAVSSSPGDLSDWSVALEAGESCSAVAHDSQGAVYAIDGKATISKYNSDGVRVYTFALPVQDENHIVRALAIDDFDRIYVGVSEGGSQSNAWIRCYIPDDEKNLVRRWEVRPGAFCEQLVLRDDKLYAALNAPDSARSRWVVYEDLATGTPSVAFERTGVPYPTNGIDVNDKGEVFTAHEPRTGTAPDARFYDPRTPTHTAILDQQRWDPTKLDNWDRRKYVWMLAEDLEDLEDGDDVLEWPDTRGRGLCRFFKDPTPIPNSSDEYKAPVFRKNAIAHKPAVQFLGDWYRLITDPSIGDTVGMNDSQPILLPNRTGHAIFMVLKVGDDDVQKGIVFGQRNNDGPSDSYVRLLVNTASDNTYDGGAVSAGSVCITYRGIGGGGSDISYPLAANRNGFSTNDSGVVIVTILCDAKTGGSGFDRSYFRVNGYTVAKWDSEDQFTKLGEPSILGCLNDGTLGPSVAISEILVLRQYTDPNDTIAKVATCPDVNGTADYGTADAANVGTHDDAVSDTEVERIEGYLAWKYGVSHLLDDGADDDGTVSWGANGPSWRVLHPFTSRSTADTNSDPTFAPPNPNGRAADEIDFDLLRDDALTVKWSAQRGNVRWVKPGAGMGYCVKLDSAGNVFTLGTQTGGGNQSAQGRKLLGKDGANSWNYIVRDAAGAALSYAYKYPRPGVDSFDNFYVPFNCPGAANLYSVVCLPSAGTGGGSAGQTPFLSYAANSGTVRPGRAVSVSPRVPDYVANATTITRPELIAIGLESTAAAQTTLHHVRLVNATSNNLPARLVKYVGVVNGSVVTYASTGAPSIVSANALSSSATYVASANAFGKVFFTDGINYRYYDPRAGTVSRWSAEDGGGIVPRYKLLAPWRGRMVLARGDDDPQNWQMSEAGNPFGWDFFPPDSPLATQAIIGNEAEIGRVPDVITALIPYDRERLIFGCDHTIYIMWGDPMENGSIVLASDITGMAFGSSWAKDADGAIYFFGSRGGVYMMVPGGAVVKLSGETIDRRLQDVDLDAYYPTLVWDEDLRELRVFLCSKTIGSVTSAHWAWCKRTNSWHQDKFSAAAVQPTCAAVFDSDDPEDRVVVIGCEDGYVRKVDRDAASDDGRTIESWVTIGPFATPDGGIRLQDPRVLLAREQSGATIEMMASEEPDVSFKAQQRAFLRPGDNARKMMGVRGSYAWVRIHNAAANTRWAYEQGRIGVYSAGRRVTRDG